MIYYHLSRKPAGEIKLQIFDSTNKLVRTISSIQPPLYERPPYPDYWLKPSAARALATDVGTSRINWDFRYDDPPGYNPDINNQMNSTPAEVTPGPHGPLALPGTYTLKLLVDGQTYSQPLVVHNDPRIGEGAAVMSAIKAQHKLMIAAYDGMKQAYAGNDEVSAVRSEITALGTLPADVASMVTAVDAKLNAVGSAAGGRGGRGGGGRGGGAPAPGETRPFNAINGTFNTVVALTQNGIDMPPTPAMVHTYEGGCKEYTATLAAWKTLLTKDLVKLNAKLSDSGKPPIKIPPTKLVAPASCAFAPATPAALKK